MFQEWLAPHGGLYAQIVATKTEKSMKFGRYVEERMVVVEVGSCWKTLLVLEE
jgi:hypothetical protein